MDKLFHVFISSTYSDLQEERQRVSEALSKAGQVPEGMEIFPASSQKQIDFIKRIIDRCDYYVIILAGRYGSTATTGVSFTELEYEYAIEKGLPTLAFLHSDLGKLQSSKMEPDHAKAARLVKFRERIEQSSLVDYWNAPDQLATKVVAAIAQEVASNPGIGWIRGNRATSDQTLNEINELRKTNEELRKALAAAKPLVSVPNLAKLDDTFQIHCIIQTSFNSSKYKSSQTMTWRDILKVIGPDMRVWGNVFNIGKALARYTTETLGKDYYDIEYSTTDRERILNQLELLGFLKSAVFDLKTGGQGVFYSLTPRGTAEVARLNAVTTVD